MSADYTGGASAELVAIGAAYYNAYMPWKMIGHEWAVEHLRQHIQRGQLRHAYLLTGPDSVGKETLALRLAQALLCQEPASAPCADCRACLQVVDGVHPDLHLVEAEEVDGTLKVEQVRELQRQIALTPYEGGRRVVIIRRAHEMSSGAANALLKTLEEPPPQVVLALAARSPESLLPTIVSRCEQLGLRPVPVDVIQAALSAEFGAECAQLLACLSAGRPGLAITLGRDEQALAGRRQSLDALFEALQANRTDRFAYVKELMPGRDRTLDRRRCLDELQVWLSFWRDVMLTSFGAGVAAANIDEWRRIQRIGQAITPAAAAGAVNALQGALVAVSRNANLQLAMETALLDLPQLSRQLASAE